MKPTVLYTVYRCFVCILFLISGVPVHAEDGNVLDRIIVIETGQGTVYELLKSISEQTGYFFLYESQVVNNDHPVKIKRGKYTVRQAIRLITSNDRLNIAVLGNNILLALPEQSKELHQPEIKEQQLPLAIYGKVYDLFSKAVIPYATVSISNSSVGTITNKSGEFRLILPDSLAYSSIKISHVGYETMEVDVSGKNEGNRTVFLEPKVIPLQEVVIKAVNPLIVLEKMLANKNINYPSDPAYFTAFYREVVEHKKKNVNLTEAVIKIYKTNYDKFKNSDQVKMMKMRRILNNQEKDSIIAKIKSGINAVLMLDVIKYLPDFLLLQEGQFIYDYSHADIKVIDDRYVNVISFEQKKEIKEPLERGELLVDTENYALVGATFEINPRYIEKSTSRFIEKKSKLYNLTLHRAAYNVSYKPDSNKFYYLNSVRGELEFKVRKKRHLFSSTMKVGFEMVNCNIETHEVKPFSKSERMSSRTIFSETKHQYDPNFWGNFNVILPEDKLREMIMRNLSEVSGSSYNEAMD